MAQEKGVLPSQVAYKDIIAVLPQHPEMYDAEKAKWARLLDKFFADKDKIAHVFSLCDVRHDPTSDDRQMVEYLYYNLIPFSIVATKADKLSRQKVKNNVANIASIYKCGVADIIATSAVDKTGIDKVLEKIEQILYVASLDDDQDDEEVEQD